MNQSGSNLHTTTGAGRPSPSVTAAARRPPLVSRQLAAIIWIVVAWVTGTVVFELTATGGETDFVKFHTQDDSFLGFFGQPTDQAEDEIVGADHRSH